MKGFLRFVPSGISLLLLSSVVLFSCGEKAEEMNKTADTTQSATHPAQAGGTAASTEFKEGIISMSKETIAIADDVQSVEDAAAAEPRLTKTIGDFTAILKKLENLDPISVGDAENLRRVKTDPDVIRWTEKVNAQMQKLAEEHPEAYRKLLELGQKQSMEMRTEMAKLNAKIEQVHGQAGNGGPSKK